MSNIVCWVDIPVVNLDRAIAFYGAVLGEPVAKQSMGGMDLGVLPRPESHVSGCLAVVPDNKPSENGPLVYLSVNGRLDAAIAAAKEKGGRVLKEKHPIGPYGFRAVIVDSEGNRVALHSQPS